MDVLLLLLAILALAILIGGIVVQNELERRKQAVHEARSNVLAVLARRAQVVNRLVDIVHAYGLHEQITHLRVSESNASGASLRSAANDFSMTMSRISNLIPNYPDLKADRLFIDLMRQLQELEQALYTKREQFNGVVREFNTYRNQFPNVLFSWTHSEEEYYEDKNVASVSPSTA